MGSNSRTPGAASVLLVSGSQRHDEALLSSNGTSTLWRQDCQLLMPLQALSRVRILHPSQAVALGWMAVRSLPISGGCIWRSVSNVHKSVVNITLSCW
jgi:hypothetical protein